MHQEFRKLEMHELNRLSPDEVISNKKLRFVFVLDSIRSLNNVGSVFRTSDGFAAAKIYLCGTTGVPPHRDIQKTALGATDTVAWEFFQDITICLENLKSAGYQIISLEQTSGSTSLQDFIFQKDIFYAIVLGNEISGVSDEALKVTDHVIEIPQFGAKHSLNVSVTAGIVAWEFLRQSLEG
jgi:tRNA G18 (ribose-2'-O)-methylase SpoU